MSIVRRMAGAGQMRRMGRGGGGVPAFVPTDISGNVLWLRADLGVTAVFGNVSAWADQSGNGHDATQSTSSTRPAYNSTDANFGGKPTIGFDAASTETLYADTLASVLSGADRPITVSISMRTNATSNFPVSFGNSTDNNPQWFVRFTPNLVIRKADDAAAVADVTSTSAWDTNPHVVTVVHDGTTTSVYDGTTAIPGMSGAAQDVGQVTLDRFTLGCLRRASEVGHWTGQIAEISVYDRAITASELSRLAGYQAARYGL